MQEELRKFKVKMKNTDLKGNVETMDISDLETVTERTELGLRVSKIEHMQKTKDNFLLFGSSELTDHVPISQNQT